MLHLNTLEKLIVEISQTLKGKKIKDVSSPFGFPEDIIFFFEGSDKLLRIAFGKERSRINLQNKQKIHPSPIPQIRQLSKELKDKVLNKISLYPNEPIVFIEFLPGDSSLIVELFGKGFWCLVNNNKEIKIISRETKSKRMLKKGAIWVPPEPKLDKNKIKTNDPFAYLEKNINEKAEEFFKKIDEKELQLREKREKEQLLNKALKKTKALIKNLEKELENAEKAQSIRKKAELLKINLKNLKRGMKEIEVQDFFDPELKRIKIELDPSKEPKEIIENLFKKAKKLDKGKPKIIERLNSAKNDLKILEEANKDLAEKGTFDIEKYKNSLSNKSLLKVTTPKEEKEKKKKEKKGIDFRIFKSKEGMQILVGKNDEQNHLLSFVIAKGNDIWMHVGSGYQGSHVVIRVPKNKTPSLDTLLDGAHLAIYFSKARGKNKMEVIYTQKKFISKPKHAPKGRVIVTRHKTLMVELDKTRLETLLAQNK